MNAQAELKQKQFVEMSAKTAEGGIVNETESMSSTAVNIPPSGEAVDDEQEQSNQDSDNFQYKPFFEGLFPASSSRKPQASSSRKPQKKKRTHAGSYRGFVVKRGFGVSVNPVAIGFRAEREIMLSASSSEESDIDDMTATIGSKNPYIVHRSSSGVKKNK